MLPLGSGNFRLKFLDLGFQFFVGPGPLERSLETFGFARGTGVFQGGRQPSRFGCDFGRLFAAAFHLDDQRFVFRGQFANAQPFRRPEIVPVLMAFARNAWVLSGRMLLLKVKTRESPA